MSLERFEMSTVIPASPDRVYEAWLDSADHSAMTGGDAEIDPRVGGPFTAWDGYIEGTTTELAPGRRIVQRWQTSEFPPGSSPSVLEVELAQHPGGTLLTLRHSEIPEGQGDSYRQGWGDHYFTPMTAFFEAAAKRRRATPRRKTSASKRTATPKRTKTSASKRKAATPKRKTGASKRPAPKKRGATRKPPRRAR